jgi:hypothetical protein
MPKKLMDCISDVKAQGKSEDSAYGICIASTGLHPEHHKKKKKDVNKAIDTLSNPALLKAWEEYHKSLLHPEKKEDVEVKYHPDAPEMCNKCKKNKTEGGSNMCFQCNLGKAWDEFAKEWKPYKEWIKDKEEGRNAPKKAKVDKKDKPWKKKDKK